MDAGDVPAWAERLPATLADRARRFDSAEVRRTVWADRATMASLGIGDDVVSMLDRMGLPGLVDFRYPTYREPTIQFFTTLQLRDSDDCDDGAGASTASFYLNGRRHCFRVSELSSVFGFPNDFGRETKTEAAAKELWRMMTQEDYRGDTARTFKIRNPVLRYAVRVVANSVFGRKDAGKAKVRELCLLYRGMPERDGEAEPSSQANNTYLFLLSILEYRSYVLQHNNEPVLGFGGMLVPLFQLLRIDLSDFTMLEGIPVMDIDYLTQIRSCYLTPTGEYQHRWSMGNIMYQCLLPLPQFTSPTSLQNIRFDIPADLYYDPQRRSRVRRPAVRFREPTPAVEDSDEELPAEFSLPVQEAILPPDSPETEEGKAWASYSVACHQRHEREIGILRKMTGWLAKQNQKLAAKMRRMSDDMRRFGCHSATDAVPPTGGYGASTSRTRRSRSPPSESDRPSDPRRARTDSPSAHSQFSDPQYDVSGNLVDS